MSTPPLPREVYGPRWPRWWVRRRGLRWLRHGWCPCCYSSPARPDCPVCWGREHRHELPPEVASSWRARWEAVLAGGPALYIDPTGDHGTPLARCTACPAWGWADPDIAAQAWVEHAVQAGHPQRE